MISAGNIQADPANTDNIKYDIFVDVNVPMTSTSYGNLLEPGASVGLPGGGTIRLNLSTIYFRNDSADIQKINILATES